MRPPRCKRRGARSAQLIGFLSVLLAFSSLSLFVVTKSNQKRPDKRNSLRLRLRSDSLLSQWKGWLTLRALRWKMYDVFGVGLTAKRWHFYSQGWSAAEPLVENAESSAVRVPIKIEQRMTGSDGKAQILIGKLIGNDEMVATPRRLRMSEPMNDRFLDALYRHRRPTAASSLQTRGSGVAAPPKRISATIPPNTNNPARFRISGGVVYATNENKSYCR